MAQKSKPNSKPKSSSPADSSKKTSDVSERSDGGKVTRARKWLGGKLILIRAERYRQHDPRLPTKPDRSFRLRRGGPVTLEQPNVTHARAKGESGKIKGNSVKPKVTSNKSKVSSDEPRGNSADSKGNSKKSSSNLAKTQNQQGRLKSAATWPVRFMRQRRLSKPNPDELLLSSGRVIINQSLAMLFTNKWLFFKMIIVHGVVYFFFVRAPEVFSIDDLNELLWPEGSPDVSTVQRTYDLTKSVIGTKTTEIREPLQAVVVWIVASLAYIWTMREIIARKRNGNDEQILARDGFFRGQSGFAVLAMLLLMMIAELGPFALGYWIYNVADQNVIFVNGFEQSLFIGVWVFLSIITVYSLMRSAIAIYFASIPNIYPVQAQQLAGGIVRYRRLIVLRKMIFMLLLLAFLLLIILVMTVSFASKYSFIAADVIIVISVPLYHLMFYHLYLDLVRDRSNDSDD